MPLTDFQREVLGIIAANRDELGHFAGGLVLNADPDSARFSHDFDIFHEVAEDVARSSDADVATLRAAGYKLSFVSGDWSKPATFRKAIVKRGRHSGPLSLLGLMRRFAKIDPLKLHEIQARNLDPIALKHAWIEMSEEAEAKITHLADTLPDTPIGVAFVDASGYPGWPGDHPGLGIHHPSIRGCLPRVDGLEPKIPRGI